MHNKKNSQLFVLMANAMVMALYVVISRISPISAGPIQFRLSEGLNHLVVFNRKWLAGVLGGVVIFNALFGYGIWDVVFGGGQTLLALLLTALTEKWVKNIKVRLALNTLFFTASMFLIAIMLHITAELPFWATYGTLALSELIVMSLTAPLMYYLNQRIDFANRI